MNGRVIEDGLRGYLLGDALMPVRFATCARDNGLHHQVVRFDDRWVDYSAELLIIVHLELASAESTATIAMLLVAGLAGLSRIRLALGQIHVNCFPSVVLVLPID